jgi:hypothetical protein
MSTVLTWNDDSGAAVSMVFDVDNQETHEFQTEVTEYPVEEGADVADNARDLLDSFTLNAWVGENPLPFNPEVFNIVVLKAIELQIPEPPSVISASAAVSAGLKAAGSALFGSPAPPRAQMFTLDQARSRKKLTLELLDRARKDKRLLRVLTSMRDYEDMLITQISVTRSVQDQDGAEFTVALKNVRFVDSETVAAPKPSEAIGSTKKTSGSKNAADDKANKADQKRQSLLSQIASGAKSGLDALGI